MRARAPRVASNIASSILTDFNISQLQMTIDTNRESRAASFQSTIPHLSAPITFANVQTAARDAYAFVTNPSRIADSFMHAYIAIGVDAYAAITASLFAYRSLVEESGTQSLALAAAARDALATAPRFVAGVNLAFGTAIIDASRAAVRADTMVAYWLAEAAPRSARATVALLGETGDLLARGATRVPALATTLFLRATSAPAHLAPALAHAVFNAEYAVSARFVKDMRDLSEGYLGALTTTGRLAYEGAAGTLALARTATSLIAAAPGALEDASLAALGKIAYVGTYGVPTWVDSVHQVPQIAAVLHTLSAGERIALAVYETIRDFFDTARRALAFLFGSSPQVAIAPPAQTATTTSPRPPPRASSR